MVGVVGSNPIAPTKFLAEFCDEHDRNYAAGIALSQSITFSLQVLICKTCFTKRRNTAQKTNHRNRITKTHHHSAAHEG
jgi:hypothetical protein